MISHINIRSVDIFFLFIECQLCSIILSYASLFLPQISSTIFLQNCNNKIETQHSIHIQSTLHQEILLIWRGNSRCFLLTLITQRVHTCMRVLSHSSSKAHSMQRRIVTPSNVIISRSKYLQRIIQRLKYS